LPSASTWRWEGSRRKGAEILTVLLVVVLFDLNISLFPETVQLALGGLTFYRASHPDESSLEHKNGHRLGEIQGQCPF
jgi:hypothetical protein